MAGSGLLQILENRRSLRRLVDAVHVKAAVGKEGVEQRAVDLRVGSTEQSPSGLWITG